MTPAAALAFVKRHGIVLQAARGPVPSLAEAIAGAPIRGSWWGHPRGKEIFRAVEAVSDHPDVLACKLVDGRVTFVHRRLWPALVKLASRLPAGRIARVFDEHTESGAHRSREEPFPKWVPADIRDAAAELTEADAERALSWAVIAEKPGRRRKS